MGFLPLKGIRIQQSPCHALPASSAAGGLRRTGKLQDLHAGTHDRPASR
jgi:hypothetical protein